MFYLFICLLFSCYKLPQILPETRQERNKLCISVFLPPWTLSGRQKIRNSCLLNLIKGIKLCEFCDSYFTHHLEDVLLTFFFIRAQELKLLERYMMGNYLFFEQIYLISTQLLQFSTLIQLSLCCNPIQKFRPLFNCVMVIKLKSW